MDKKYFEFIMEKFDLETAMAAETLAEAGREDEIPNYINDRMKRENSYFS